MPESTLIKRKHEEFNIKTKFDFKDDLNKIIRSNTIKSGSEYKQYYDPNQKLEKVKKSDGIAIIKEKNESDHIFWNKVSFLIGKRNHQKYILYDRFGKIEISNCSTNRPLLIKQTHKRCLDCSSDFKKQVSEYDHNICFYCSIDNKESEEYNYHHKQIKNLLNSKHFSNHWN